MKIQQLLEAKTGPTRLAYVEMIDDGSGQSMTYKYVTSVQELDYLHKMWKKDRNEFGFAIDETDLEDIRGGYEVFEEQWNKLKRSIQQTGSWATEFEDGAIGISARGPKHARQIAHVEFMKAFDQEEDDDEDWY